MSGFDIVELENRMAEKDKPIIMFGSYISWDDLQDIIFLCDKYGKNKFKRFVETAKNGEDCGKFEIEFVCCQCGNYDYNVSLTKSSLFKIISNPQILCNSCKEKNKAKVKPSQSSYTIKESDTNVYINNLLSVDKCFSQNVTADAKFMYTQNNNVDLVKIRKYIKNMDYQDFLLTPYWDAIRSIMLKKACYKCELCNENHNLHIHHKDYKNHGAEHLNLSDLIVLCQKCHSKFHDKE